MCQLWSCYGLVPWPVYVQHIITSSTLCSTPCWTQRVLFLWVHQYKWQKDLLLKYGNTICLIDATHKTTKYELPLFFVCVRTNVGYSVVSEFILESESTENISEAMQILHSWNPEWNPKFWMCDYSEAEISALECCFPDTTIYLCDFHREQAWERWVKDGKHGLTSDEADQLLAELRACAWAPPGREGEDIDICYKQAVQNLKESKVWKDHTCVQQWLSTTWLSIPQVCSFECNCVLGLLDHIPIN